MDSADDTGKARRTRKASGAHFRQSKAWRTFPLSKLEKITEEDAEALFRKMRWPETDGEPVCPWCGSHKSWYLENQRRWKCKAASCLKQFSITSGTPLAHHKLTFKQILTAARSFTKGAKGNNAIELSADVEIEYKTGYVLQQKYREGIMHSMRDGRLTGDVEIDGGWFGGYIKPDNRKINRVDRRLKAQPEREAPRRCRCA